MMPDAHWANLEKPLLDIEPLLDEFVKVTGANLTKNDHGEAERTVRFRAPDGVRRKLQIFLVNEEKLEFKVWAVAAEDRDDGRYWREKVLAIVSAPFQSDEMQKLLEEGRKLLEGWQKCHLKKVR